MRRTNTTAVAAFALACIAAAVAVGATLATVGAQVGVPLALVAAIALAGLLSAFPRAPFHLPSSHWQVPRHWGGPHAWWNGASFGAPLGAGFLTILPGPGLYAVAAVCLVAPLPVAAAVYGAFGVARTAPVLAAWMSPYRDETEGLTIARLAGGGTFRRVEVVLLGVLASVALAAA